MELAGSSSSQRVNVLEAMLEQLKKPEAASAAAAISYLTARATASSDHSFTEVSNWIYPDSRDLIEFERNRFNNLSVLGNPSAWNGVIEGIRSEATILDCSATRSEAKLTIRDWTSVQWRPAPVSVHRTPEQEVLATKFPEKYGLDTPDFPLTFSGFCTRHEIVMARTTRGWLVVQDGYEESVVALGNASPDHAVPPEPLQTSAPCTPDEEEPGRAFDWAAAANYAVKFARVGNTAFSEFWPNDCANFASQCLAAGGYPTDEVWAPYTPAWINNTQLRDWLIASGKGQPTDEGALGFGDIINYNWQAIDDYDGVAIVTGLPGPLVSCHSAEHLNVPYKAIARPGTTFVYTSTLSSY